MSIVPDPLCKDTVIKRMNPGLNLEWPNLEWPMLERLNLEFPKMDLSYVVW
jgi:hypothetical protein